jgi:hypothetical protein
LSQAMKVSTAKERPTTTQRAVQKNYDIAALVLVVEAAFIIVQLLPLTSAQIGSIANLIFTVEGVLLGLTALIVGKVTSFQMKAIVTLTTISLIFSIVTIIAADSVSFQYLQALFGLDLGLFGLLVASYEIAVLRAHWRITAATA